MWKKEKRITEIKYTRNISFPETRKIIEQTLEQPSYGYVTKKETRKRKIQNQNRKNWINWLMNKNLIEILKMITKETIKEHILIVPENVRQTTKIRKKNPKQRKEKIQTKQKKLINEPIPLSNRFNPMDIDPVETTIEDSDETITHIKTDTIKLQKRLHKKINTKDNQTENETNPTKKKTKKKTQATKSRHRSTSKSKEKEKITPH